MTKPVTPSLQDCGVVALTLSQIGLLVTLAISSQAFGSFDALINAMTAMAMQIAAGESSHLVLTIIQLTCASVALAMAPVLWFNKRNTRKQAFSRWLTGFYVDTSYALAIVSIYSVIAHGAATIISSLSLIAAALLIGLAFSVYTQTRRGTQVSNVTWLLMITCQSALLLAQTL